MRAESHCGTPLVEVGPLRACHTCRRVFRLEDDALRELRGPTGVRVRLATAARGSASGYRTAARPSSPALLVERFWLARWWPVAAFGTIWSVGVTAWGVMVTGGALGLFGHLEISRPVAAMIGSLVLAIGAAALYVVATLWLNRTEVVVDRAQVVRRDRPLRWRRPPCTITRTATHEVLDVPVQTNDVRNLSARWPAPTTHEIRLAAADGEPLVLFDQIVRPANALAVRNLVAEVMAATRD